MWSLLIIVCHRSPCEHICSQPGALRGGASFLCLQDPYYFINVKPGSKHRTFNPCLVKVAHVEGVSQQTLGFGLISGHFLMAQYDVFVGMGCTQKGDGHHKKYPILGTHSDFKSE